jgi:hypothetical protein
MRLILLIGRSRCSQGRHDHSLEDHSFIVAVANPLYVWFSKLYRSVEPRHLPLQGQARGLETEGEVAWYDALLWHHIQHHT